jgi:Glycosyl transferase family 8
LFHAEHFSLVTIAASSGAASHTRPMSIDPFFHACGSLFPDQHKPWLILGKGPSFARYERERAAHCYTMGLNHVGAQTQVDLAHVIDIEVIEQCGESLLQTARYVVMPWIPHIRHERTLLTPKRIMDASGINLEEWAAIHSSIAELAKQRRLLCYNLSTAPAKYLRPDDPRVVPVTYFSASAAVELLAQAGYRTIRTLGIDGGSQYAQDFDKLAAANLFANGRTTFDLQFEGITRTIMQHGIDFAPADIEAPIRVLVGAEPEQDLPFKVLEHSIKRHATMSVRVEPLWQALANENIRVTAPKSPELAPRTPFSYQRFAIPALKGYRGRAIYLDSDMQVFDDIKKLWTMPFDGAPMLAVQEREGSRHKPQFSVLLLDCAALRWNIDELIADLDRGRWTYEEFMFDMAAAPGTRASIPFYWNDMERHEPGRTALTHFTDMDQQPWLETVNPNAYVWCQGLLDAVADRWISRDFVAQEVALGHVRPSLLAQLDLGIADPLMLPKSARALDSQFLPPHVVAAAASKNGGTPPLWRVRFARRTRMLTWQAANKLGLWEGFKTIRQQLKAARQNMRVADARRRRGMS